MLVISADYLNRKDNCLETILSFRELKIPLEAKNNFEEIRSIIRNNPAVSAEEILTKCRPIDPELKCMKVLNSAGSSLIQIVINENRLDVMKKIVAQVGSQFLNLGNILYEPPLFSAIQNKKNSSLRELIRLGAKVHCITPPDFDSSVRCPLILAANIVNNIDVIAFLLRHGTCIDIVEVEANKCHRAYKDIQYAKELILREDENLKLLLKSRMDQSSILSKIPKDVFFEVMYFTAWTWVSPKKNLSEK